MGGSNRVENLVYLTPKEHFVAHQLLVKMHPTVTKLIFALHLMSCSGTVTHRMYDWLKRRRAAECQRPQMHRRGVAHTAETRSRISATMSGRPSNTTGKQWSATRRANHRVGVRPPRGPTGVPRSDEVKQKISMAQRGVPKSAESIAKMKATKLANRQARLAAQQ